MCTITSVNKKMGAKCVGRGHDPQNLDLGHNAFASTKTGPYIWITITI